MTEEIKKWDYRVQTFGSIWGGTKSEDIEAALQEWGVEGWEVVSAFNSDNKTTILAKRPLTRETIRARSMPTY